MITLQDLNDTSCEFLSEIINNSDFRSGLIKQFASKKTAFYYYFFSLSACILYVIIKIVFQLLYKSHAVAELHHFLNPNVLTVSKITFSRKGKNVIDHVMLSRLMSLYVILNAIIINVI